MKVLGIDTSTMGGSAAVVDENRTLYEHLSEDKSSYSNRLLEMIDSVIQSSHLTINDIDGFAVSSGPGSFTGLRIGIATISGIALALDKPVVGISSLHAIALSFPHLNGLLCPVIDARKNEIYTALYRRTGEVLERVSEEMVTNPPELCKKIDGHVTFIGKDAERYKDILKKELKEYASFAEYAPANSTAAGTAAIGLRMMQEDSLRKRASPFITVSPNYIRRSDAEINWEKQRAGSSNMPATKKGGYNDVSRQ